MYDALTRDTYNKGGAHYSITELLNPPQIVQLKRRYEDQLEEDVMDNVWSIMGKAAHTVLEAHATEDSLSEERLSTTILSRTVSGQTDNYHNGVITDYKITSAYTLVYGRMYKKWEEQLNCYAHIFREHGHEVHKLQVVAILRDWSETKAKQDPRGYPQTPIQIVNLTLWTPMEASDFLFSRVADQVFNEEVPDSELRWCSSEDMWEQPSKYAVIREGRKSAIRVVDSYDEAVAYMVANGSASKQNDAENTVVMLPEYSIVTRPGTRTRCERYCPVKNFCHQYKEYVKDAGGTETQEGTD